MSVADSREGTSWQSGDQVKQWRLTSEESALCDRWVKRGPAMLLTDVTYMEPEAHGTHEMKRKYLKTELRMPLWFFSFSFFFCSNYPELDATKDFSLFKFFP